MLRRRWIVASVAIGLLYAVLASTTRPFTWAAYVVTAVPIVVAAFATAWTNRKVAARIAAVRAGVVNQHPARWDRRWMAWVVLMAVATSWELFCLASLPRAQHPTLSSLIDLLDSTWVGKSAAFVLWLALGWFLVAR